MKKVRLDEKMLTSTPVGKIIIKTGEVSKLASSIGTKLTNCYIVSSIEKKVLLDPFRARAVLSDIESDPTISKALGAELITEAKNSVDDHCKNLQGTFEANLREYCSKHNISIDGRFPKFIIGDFLQVAVQTSKGTLKIGTKETRSFLMEAISPTIEEILAQESERGFNKSPFLDELYNAYERVVLLQRSTSGNPVPIKDLFNELVFVKQPQKFKNNSSRSNFYEYTREFFLRDLAKLVRSGPNVVKGKRLQLIPTSLTDQAFPFFMGGSIRYIGRIVFSEVNQ
jgi:hypothetical protein